MSVLFSFEYHKGKSLFNFRLLFCGIHLHCLTASVLLNLIFNVKISEDNLWHVINEIFRAAES